MPRTASIRRLRVGSDWIEYDDSGDGGPVSCSCTLECSATGSRRSPRKARWASSVSFVLGGARYVAGGSARPPPDGLLITRATSARLLLDEIGCCRAAHVCGHSSGALSRIAAGPRPTELVHSPRVADPAPGGDLLGPINAPVDSQRGWSSNGRRNASGDVGTGIERFMNAVCGSHHRLVMERVLVRQATSGRFASPRSSRTKRPPSSNGISVWRRQSESAFRHSLSTVKKRRRLAARTPRIGHSARSHDATRRGRRAAVVSVTSCRSRTRAVSLGSIADFVSAKSDGRSVMPPLGSRNEPSRLLICAGAQASALTRPRRSRS
jgi:hypothetical protein